MTRVKKASRLSFDGLEKAARVEAEDIRQALKKHADVGAPISRQAVSGLLKKAQLDPVERTRFLVTAERCVIKEVKHDRASWVENVTEYRKVIHFLLNKDG